MRTRILPNLIILAAASFAAAGNGAIAGAKTTTTWNAPDLAPATYAKVVVLAKVQDDVARRVLEDTVVQGLRDRGVTAVAAYEVLTDADLKDEASIRAKADELGLDGGIVFRVTDENTQVKSGSKVHASVGVPVRAGRFSMFVGTSVPIGGGPSTVKTAFLNSELYVADADGPRWIASYSVDLRNGAAAAAKDVAGEALKQVKKAKLFAGAK